MNTASPVRRIAVSALALTAVTGSLLAAAPASAATGAIPKPAIQLVDGRGAVDHVAGKQVFQVDQRSFGISVVTEPGALRITDSDGAVLCELTEAASTSQECRVRDLASGEHELVATVTNRWGTVSSDPVTLESFAEDAGDAGDGEDAGTPGDGAGEAEPVVAQPNPGETDPAFTVGTPGDEQEQSVPAEVVQVRPGDSYGYATVEFSGKPGQFYFVDQIGPGSTGSKTGIVPESGRFEYTVTFPGSTQERVKTFTQAGPMADQAPAVFTVDIPDFGPGAGQPDEPVVALPNPGGTDEGFAPFPGDESEQPEEPGAGDSTLELVSVKTVPWAGQADITLRDTETKSGYNVFVYSDGRGVASGVVQAGGKELLLRPRGLGAGHHVITVKDFDGNVLLTFPVDI